MSTTAASAAYAYCAEVTRREARNFFYGIRLLPPPKRAALSAVYALARRIDDLGDSPGLDRPARLARLADLRARLGRGAGLAAGGEDPVLVAVADAAGRFDIPLSAFVDLIDGVEMDLAATDYRTFAELEVYCRRVAGSIGRLCLGVFGSREPERAARLADDLGVALQLTNILRDLAEDTAGGRWYLPAEDLAAFGLTVGQPLGEHPDRLAALVRAEADRARTYYAEGLRLLPLLDRRSAASAGAMAGIYAEVLERIAAQPSRVLAGRVSLPGWRKAAVAIRSLAGVQPHPVRVAAGVAPTAAAAADGGSGGGGTRP